MNKRLLDICQQLPDVDVSEFQKFTSKWINYVKSNTAGDKSQKQNGITFLPVLILLLA